MSQILTAPKTVDRTVTSYCSFYRPAEIKDKIHDEGSALCLALCVLCGVNCPLLGVCISACVAPPPPSPSYTPALQSGKRSRDCDLFMSLPKIAYRSRNRSILDIPFFFSLFFFFYFASSDWSNIFSSSFF